MNSFNNFYNSSIISLEENNSYPKLKYKKRRGKNEIENSSNSFFSKIINSVSKIGQGLKYIMSMKINIEEDDSFDPEVYNRIRNRFNMREEMSLIEAPSFIDGFYTQKNNNNSIGYNNYNNMFISRNETQRYDNNYNYNNDTKDFENLNNLFNKGQQEIINTDVNIENTNKKIDSNLLKKKREREDNIIKEEINEDSKEELKDDEMEKSMNKKSEIKSKAKADNNNVSDYKKRINSSINSISIKSLDNLKNEIEQKKLENLKNIEEMYQRNDSYYDYLKDVQTRANTLDEYFKEKVKKIEMEKEKRKKEEKKKKFKVNKSTDLKFYCIPKKKPKIFAERKAGQFEFIGKPKIKIESVNTSININNNNNNVASIKSTATFFTENNNNNNNDNNDNKSISINENNNNNKEDSNKTETKLIFNNNPINDVQKINKLPVLISKEENIDKIKEKENSNTKETKKNDEKEQKLTFTLFTTQNPRKDIFSNTSNTNTNKTNPNPWNVFNKFNPVGGNVSNIENKKEEKNIQNNMDVNKGIPNLFTTTNTNDKNIFSSNNPKPNESLFFGIGINPSKQKNSIFNNTPKKEGLFSQQTSVSSSINQTNLFTSNKPEEKGKEVSIQNNPFFGKIENKTFDLFANIPKNNDTNAQNNQPFNNNQKGNLFGQPTSIFSASNTSSTIMPSKYENDQGSLLSQNNPFLSNKTVSNTQNIFGNNKNDIKNVQNNQTQNIFGPFSKGSLFGN